MRKKMLRSVLVAAFSAVMAFGGLSGLSDGKSDIRADTAWPAAPVSTEPAEANALPIGADDGAGS